ncbi:AraC family transcriptional regulator [Kribbella sp. NPDC051620]|uniref:AraC family transcriptional regulator n=1 Tax=Kribbella sp. NPDC051620 TaxID=3364120 RepID=UPI0037A863EF
MPRRNRYPPRSSRSRKASRSPRSRRGTSASIPSRSGDNTYPFEVSTPPFQPHAAVFLHQGEGQLLHGPDRVLHAIEAPALFWLFPGVLHGYRPSTTWRGSWVLFGGSATTALTHLGYLTPESPVRRYADPRPIQRAFAKLLRVAQTSEVQATAALYDLIATATPDEPGAELVARLRAIACRPLTIPQYAEALGVTVDELRAATRSASGSTPQEVILTTRMNQAKALLAESDLPVAVVAREIGYDDPAYFSRLFSARVGQAPRTFRRIGSISGPRSSF